MSRPVRIALLGAGFVADCYMQGLANVAGHEVALVCGRRPRAARAFAKRWGIPETAATVEAAIAREDVDLFIIALPNAMHLPVSLALSRARRHQVCTKPLARTAKEARAMWTAARASGRMHGYAETEVFAPAVVKAREIIERGGIGRVQWVRARESHAGPHSAHFWNAQAAGGGALIDLAGHCIEAARYFFGKEDRIVEVMGWGARLVHGDKTEGEDNALLLLRMSSGGLAQCEVSWTTRGGLDLRNEIQGSAGTLYTDVTGGTPVRAFTSRPAGHIIEKAELDVGWTRPLPDEAFAYGYQAEMRHFVECVRDGREPRETYEDGHVVNAVIDAGYRSMRTRRWVRVKP